MQVSGAAVSADKTSEVTMPYANRTREFSFTMDLTGLAPAARQGDSSEAQLGWAVVGSPTFPTMALSQITEQSGQPFELALPGILPLANRRLEWELADWDERIMRAVGRPYGRLGAVDGTTGNPAATTGLPRFEFNAVSRRNQDEMLKTTRFICEGALVEATPVGLTGGEYSRLQCVVDDVQRFKVVAFPWVAPGTTLGTEGAADETGATNGATIRDIDLITPKYEVNGFDRWAGLYTALDIA